MKIQLCCGPKEQLKNWINVDARDFGQQIVADINNRWSFADDSAVSEIYCKDGFEHVESAEHFLSESYRTLKPGGTLTLWLAHFKNPSAYRVTHKRLFSWSYFNAYPEPHDAVQGLRVISIKLYIGHKKSSIWKLPHILINLAPKWWERFAYVSNIEVVLKKEL